MWLRISRVVVYEKRKVDEGWLGFLWRIVASMTEPSFVADPYLALYFVAILEHMVKFVVLGNFTLL